MRLANLDLRKIAVRLDTPVEGNSPKTIDDAVEKLLTQLEYVTPEAHRFYPIVDKTVDEGSKRYSAAYSIPAETFVLVFHKSPHAESMAVELFPEGFDRAEVIRKALTSYSYD